jgi:cell division protein FtsB
MLTASPSFSAHEQTPDTISGLVISLLFWLCMLVSAVLFGVVSLSPKLLVYLQLRSRFDVNQRKLVGLENQADQLQRVIDAMQHDKEFAQELLRIEFDAARPDEEIIPVDFPLKRDARVVETPLPEIAAEHEWYEPVVKHLASDSKLRTSLLGAAAMLVVVSFTLLQPDGLSPRPKGAHQSSSTWQNLCNRYSRRF